MRASRPALLETVNRYLRFAFAVQHYAAGTIRDVRCTLLSFAAFCEALSLTDPAQIRSQTTIAWVRSMRTPLPATGRPPLSDASLRKNYAHLKGFFAYLVASQILDADPSAFLKLSLRKGDKAMNVLSVAEADRLLEATDPSTPGGLRDRLVVGILWVYGLRCAELVALNVADVDFPRGTLTVRKGKGSKPRVLPLVPGVIPRLQEWVAHRLRDAGPSSTGAPLLVTAAGARLSQQGVNQVLSQAAARAGISRKVTALTLRHTFATHLANQGVDISVISRMMGHNTIAETTPYVHATERDLREACAQLGKIAPPLPARSPEELRRLPYQGPNRRKEQRNG